MSETNIESLCVYRNGHHLFVGDGETSIVVASQALKTQPDPDHGYRVFRQCDSLLRPRDGMRRANAGLLPLLRLLAQQDGREVVEVCESRFQTLPDPVDDPRIIDNTLAPFLGSRERGLIRVGPSVCFAQIIAQVTAAYPACRIAILGSHRAQLQSTYKKLKNWLSTHAIRREVPPDDSGAWVAFSTFTAAAAGDLEKCHLVILLDATHAAHQRAEPALAAMDAQFRLFGLLRDDRRLSPTERAVLMATYGPALLDIPRHGGELAEVNLAWVPTHGRPVPDADPNPITLFRQGYWQHRARNRKIARLAMALRGGNPAPPNTAISQWLADHPDHPPRVTVLVGSLEHAVTLARQMPGWDIIAGDSPLEPVNTSGWDDDRARLLAERRTVLIAGEQQIVTQTAALTGQLPSTDVVIWAGGGPHAPEIPRQWLLRPTGLGGRLLLIDCLDRFMLQLAHWSNDRNRDYQDREWFDVGISPEVGRVMRFLDQRPRHRRRRKRASQ